MRNVKKIAKWFDNKNLETIEILIRVIFGYEKIVNQLIDSVWGKNPNKPVFKSFEKEILKEIKNGKTKKGENK